MFKLIIADDEPRIREGLLKIVDWTALGFEVAGCYADGTQVLAHLKRNAADAVLTDIRMPRLNGLEVAREIREHFPHTLCVLVSAYQEFEFAHQAISLGVADYLFKPTRISDIRRVFGNLAKRLEQEAVELEAADERQRRYEEMNELWRRQTLYDLYMGILPEEESIRRQMAHFYPDVRECAVLLRLFSVSAGDQKLNDDELKETLRHTLRGDRAGVKYDAVYVDAGEAAVAAVVEAGDTGEKAKILDEALAEAVRQAKDVTGIELKLEKKGAFPSLSAFAGRPRTPLRLSMEADAGQLDGESVRTIRSQQQLMLNYIRAGERDKVMNLSDAMLSGMSALTVGMQKNLVMDTVSRLQLKLQETEQIPFSVPRYDSLWNAGEETAEWFREQLEAFLSQIPRQKNTQWIVRQLKNYIQENYGQQISLETASEHVCLSAVYISRIFKQETGEGFTDYLTGVRLEKAKELLVNPDIRVYDVGQRTGYPNPRYFYRVFKRLTGLTPGQYRRVSVGKETE